MSTMTPAANLERIEQLIARSETTTAFLHVQRLEHLIKQGELTGAITIDGYPASHAQIALNIQVEHYRDLCRKNNLPIHI